MATLYLLDEDGAIAEEFELGTRPITIGRDESATVVIEDQTLSRRHFIISREEEGFVLQDLGSQNGTWVDGHQALKERTRLHHNVCILAGRTLFLFSEHRLHLDAPAQSKPASRKTDLLRPSLEVNDSVPLPISGPTPG